jgi:SNF2 family DNA or RNA helicase
MGGLHPRTEQKVIFDMLCNEPDFQVASKDLTTQWSVKKRLQRGRKFLLLVKLFGEKILHAGPEVSVTRLELVKLEDLTKLATGSAETSRVKRILARMGSVDRKCMTLRSVFQRRDQAMNKSHLC